jgi:CHAT domain-containing protein/Tfp pilus assembly protein PilF
MALRAKAKSCKGWSLRLRAEAKLSGLLHRAMKVQASSSFAAPICVIVIILGLGFSFLANAQAPAEDDSPAELNRRIDELYNEGKFKEAIPLAEKLVALIKQQRGEDDAETAASINLLAQLYERTGDYAKAEPLYKEALEIRQKVFGREDPLTAQSLNNLGLLYWYMGDYPKAEPLLKEALEFFQKTRGREDPNAVISMNNLGLLYLDMGDYAKAELLLGEALKIRRKALGPEDPNTATSLSNLAELYRAMGEYAKAEPLYQEALEIRQKVLGREHPDTALSLDNLAGLYWAIGDYTKAEPLYKEAIEIRQKVLGRAHPDTATSLNNLAALYRDMGDYAKAEPLYKEALEIQQKVFGRAHLNTATSLNNLAALYRDMGDYAKAEPLFKEALEISQKVFGQEHPFTATSLHNLAELYATMGDYSKAEPLYQEALEIYQKVLGQDHPLTVRNLESLAFAELDLGKTEEAKRLSQLGYAAGLKVFSQILSFGSEDERLAYQRLVHPYTLFAALDETDALLASAVLHYKGVVLDSIIEDRLVAETSKEEANRELVEQLKTKKRTLSQLSLQTASVSPKEASERVEAVEQEVENIEGKLARQITDLGQARRSLAVTVEQVQAAIPNDAVLVEYVRYGHYLGKSKGESRYAAVLLSPGSSPHWFTLGSAKEIEAALRRYQVLVRTSSAEDELEALLQKLYDEVWEPIQRALPDGVKTVIISPDGQLNFLSFATLVDGDKRFVADRYSIRYVASGRDLLRELKPTQNHQVVVLANPKFDRNLNAQIAKSDLPTEGSGVLRGTEKRDFEDMSFGDLGGTQQESDQLLGQFKRWGWPTKSFTGAEVTKQVLSELHGPYILHLATHGFFEAEDPTLDANPTESPSPNIKFDFAKARFFKNPMHRSGLALAGANTTIAAWKRGEAPPIEEDGILSAEDVSTLDLKGTWLVTLSACDTGSGEARAGEGVMGLRRGFVEAGAQNLLMTLWPISDEFTIQIMSDFYEAAHQTGNAPEALAKVQREWLVKLRKEKGLANAVNLAGPFIMSSQGKP